MYLREARIIFLHSPFATYPDGVYNLKYEVDLGIADESSFDNTLEYSFVISDSIVSYCNIDTLTNLPKPNMYSRSVDPVFFFMYGLP